MTRATRFARTRSLHELIYTFLVKCQNQLYINLPGQMPVNALEMPQYDQEVGFHPHFSPGYSCQYTKDIPLN